jgi:hypothetical protein
MMTPQARRKYKEPEIVNYINGVPVDERVPAMDGVLKKSKEILPPLRTIKKPMRTEHQKQAQIYKASVLSAGGRSIGPLASAMRKHRTAGYERVSIDAGAGEVVPRSSQASQVESKNAMAPRLSKPKLVKKSPEPRPKESAKRMARINKL